MLPADVRAAGELIQAGKLLIAVTKAGSLGLGGVLEPRVRLQGGSYGGFGFLECLTMRFLRGFGLCRCFPIRFWVAGVGLGSPGGAVLMSGRQKGAGRTGHHISRPNTEPPDPMGLFSPPQTRRDFYRAKRTASLQLTLLTPQPSGHLPPTPMGQKAKNLQLPC